MSDIVERLKQTFNKEFGTYDVADDSVRIGCGTLKEAFQEIERLRATIAQLRAVAGAVSVEGKSYADVRRGIRKPFEPPDYDAFDANQSSDEVKCK